MTTTGPPRWRAGAALTVAVLAAHGLLLQALRPPAAVRTPGTVRSLSLRTIERPALPPAPLSVMEDAPSTGTPAAAVARMPTRRSPVAVPDAPPAAPSGAPSTPAPVSETSTASTVPADARASQPHADVVIPSSRQLHYAVTARTRGVTLQGESTLQWQHDADRYDARLDVRMPDLPARVQHSSGSITAAGLEPRRFSDRNRSEQASHFERGTGQVVFSSNRSAVALEPGAQDRLSVLLQLASRIAAAPLLYPPGTAIALQTVGARDADTWVFHVEGPEALQLPGGTVPALKLLRRPQREYDTTVELWLAPGMDYVPVRMRLTQANGDWLEQQWSATDR